MRGRSAGGLRGIIGSVPLVLSQLSPLHCRASSPLWRSRARRLAVFAHPTRSRELMGAKPGQRPGELNIVRQEINPGGRGRTTVFKPDERGHLREVRRVRRDPHIVSSLERMPKRRLAERLRTAGHQMAFPFKRRPFPTGAHHPLETHRRGPRRSSWLTRRGSAFAAPSLGYAAASNSCAEARSLGIERAGAFLAHRSDRLFL